MSEPVVVEPRAGADPRHLIVEACHEPWTSAWAELGEALATVTTPLREGLAQHREAMAAAGLEATPPDGWGERSERLLEYRRRLGASLLEPLAEAMLEGGPAARLASTFGQALQRANAGVEGLPARLVVPWEQAALAAHPSDGLARRLGKLVASVFSSARKAGELRALPVRTVASEYLREDVAEAQGEAVVEAMAAWAGWSARLERAWLDWADAALPALVQADLPDSEKDGEFWSVVRDAAAALQARLEALADEVPHTAAAEKAAGMLDACGRALEADLAVAGSFLLPERDGPPAALDHVEKVTPVYSSWDRDIGGRIQLYVSILAIMAGATAVQQRVIQRCREGSSSDADDLIDVAKGLRSLVPQLRRPEIRQRAREVIPELDRRVTQLLQPAFRAIPEAPQLEAAIDEATEAAVEALLAVIRQAPASLVLHDREEHPPDRKKAESRSVPLQEIARQSFDALRIERIRASTEGLLVAIQGVRGDIEGLPEVFAFARDEALRGLDTPDAEATGQAVELLEGALERMASSLETRVDDLDRALHGAHSKLAAEIAEGSAALLGRVGAGRMQAQLFAARSRAADVVARLSEVWGPRIRRLFEQTRSWVGRAYGFLGELVRRAAALLGRGSAAPDAATRSLQSLAEVQELVERLPLVYQRLFTLDPIADPALLAGRTKELDAAMQRWQRWRQDRGVPLIVRGRQRTGVTSFLKVLCSRIESEGHKCLTISLDERLASEADLAAFVSKELGLPPAGTLDDLAHAVFSADERTLPGTVTLDNLEHVYMRVPKGTDLAERLLTLMAETEPRIFWVGGISTSAWQLIATAEPSAVSQMDVMDLPPLTAADARAAILARHRRSGLDVRYEESQTTRARLLRRLRAMRDGKGFRQLLEDEFFEQLQRASGGYLGLGLFLWLQSATFDPDEGVVMSLPRRPDFSLLDRLTLTQNFTLKAFLEHRTLTLEEHDRIFRLPRHESFQIFESLRNRQLILAADRDTEGAPERSDIEVDLRYRVRPLLTGAVIAHLQARNIVH